MNTTMHPVSPEEIMASLDGELSLDEQASVSAHLEECAECAYTAEQFRQSSRQLANWCVEAAPATVQTTLLAAAKHGKPHTNAWIRRPWVLSSAGAIAATLLLAFLFASGREAQHERSKQFFMKPQAEGATQVAAAAQPSQPSDYSYHAYETAAPAPPPLPTPSSRSRMEAAVVGAASPGLIGGGGGGADHKADSSIQPPMIARSVALAIQVKDFAASRAALDAIVSRYRGYPANLTASTPEGGARSIQASLRIPASELVPALIDLKRLGRVQNESQSGEEVTQQHADLVARLKNSRETETRLQAILQQRTGKIEDVLAVEEEIARVRGEIETMDSQQQALEHRVDFATVDLQLTEEYSEPLSAPGLSSSGLIRNALVTGWRNATGFVLSILLFVAESGPTLLILGLILAVPGTLLWKRYRRLRQQL